MNEIIKKYKVLIIIAVILAGIAIISGTAYGIVSASHKNRVKMLEQNITNQKNQIKATIKKFEKTELNNQKALN